MHQSFEFARIDPDAVDIALLAPVFPEDLAEAETEAAEREDEQRRRAAATKVAQEHTLLRHPVGAPTGTKASPAFCDVALRGTNTTPSANRSDHITRGGSNQNAALAFSVATGRRVQCPTPTSLEVHIGSPDELYALLEYFPRLTSLRLHDDAQMDIADITEYLSETLTSLSSLDIHGWADHDYLDFDTERPQRACISTLPSALGLTNLRVLKLQCPTEGRGIPPVIRGRRWKSLSSLRGASNKRHMRCCLRSPLFRDSGRSN